MCEERWRDLDPYRNSGGHERLEDTNKQNITISELEVLSKSKADKLGRLNHRRKKGSLHLDKDRTYGLKSLAN